MNANHITDEQNGVSDSELRTLWRQHGGRFHGPNVETGTMPEAKLLPFLRGLVSSERRTAPAPAVPSGWKLVPVEPTQEMLAAVSWPECARTDWAHMLTAAPTPPAQAANIWTDQRARFERWATNDGAWPDNVARSSESPEEYANSYIQDAWLAVQATSPTPAQPEQADPVLVQHRKPIAGKDGETTGYTSWIDGKGLDWWPHRYLYACPTPAQPAVPESADSVAPVQLGELAKRNIYDAIRGAYDLGYNDARNARAVPGDSAPGYDGRNVEADHGGALLNSLNQRLRSATAVPEDVARDAERYRWLRDNHESCWAICEWQDDPDGLGYYRDARAPEVVDAAIDAARKAEKGGA